MEGLIKIDECDLIRDQVRFNLGKIDRNNEFLRSVSLTGLSAWFAKSVIEHLLGPSVDSTLSFQAQ